MAFDLTNEFIETLVQEPIASFTVSPGSAAGDNIGGDLKSIKVLTGDQRTLHLIHKTFPENPTEKERVKDFGIFKAENQFYNSLASDLLELSLEKTNYELPIPKYYAGHNDDLNDYITLEDLRPSGYSMPNKYEGMGLAHVSKVMEEIGKFHAASYYFLREKGERYLREKYPFISVENFFLGPFRRLRVPFIQGVYDVGVELVSEVRPDLGSRLSKYASSPFEVFEPLVNGLMNLTDTKAFPVILHGDLWVNNMLFKSCHDSSLQVKFVDWQQCRRGNIFEDLVYFIYTSTSRDFRLQHLSHVLALYFRSFDSFLKELDCPLPIGFSKGYLVDTFASLIVPALVFQFFAMPVQLGIPLDPSEILEIQREIEEEYLDAGGDGKGQVIENDLTLLTEKRTKFMAVKLAKETRASPVALKRMIDIAEEAVASGLF